MKLAAIIVFSFVLSISCYSQCDCLKNNEINLSQKDKYDFGSEISIGGGLFIITGDRGGSAFNLTGEVLFHTGLGFYIAPGVDTYDYPPYNYNHITDFNLMFRKGFSLHKNIVVLYPGAGGYLLFSSQGHPGCCEVGGLFSLRLGIRLAKNVSYGIDLKYPTGIGYNFSFFTNAYLALVF